MANINAPFGLIPLRGDAPTNPYSIASEYASDIGLGDVVELTGTGTNIARAAAENVDNLGVFAGCEYTDSSGQKQWRPDWVSGTFATDVVAYVWDDPHLIFKVQGDSVAEADIGTLVDWTVGDPGTTGRSTTYAAVNGATGTSGKSLRIKRLLDGESYGAYANIEVCFAEHIHLTGAAGAGGV